MVAPSQVTVNFPLLESADLYYGTSHDAFVIAPHLRHMVLELGQPLSFGLVQKLPLIQLNLLVLSISD